jgi:hypothetical protein
LISISTAPNLGVFHCDIPEVPPSPAPAPPPTPSPQYFIYLFKSYLLYNGGSGGGGGGEMPWAAQGCSWSPIYNGDAEATSLTDFRWVLNYEKIYTTSYSNLQQIQEATSISQLPTFSLIVPVLTFNDSLALSPYVIGPTITSSSYFGESCSVINTLDYPLLLGPVIEPGLPPITQWPGIDLGINAWDINSLQLAVNHYQSTSVGWDITFPETFYDYTWKTSANRGDVNSTIIKNVTLGDFPTINLATPVQIINVLHQKNGFRYWNTPNVYQDDPFGLYVEGQVQIAVLYQILP